MSQTGVFRGVVADNRDPLNKGRLKITVPAITGPSSTNWAWPMGRPSRPEVGTGVFVQFENGDTSYPLWSGVFGVADPIDAPENVGNANPVFKAVIGDGVTRNFTVVHGLETEDVSVDVREISGHKRFIYTDVRVLNTSAISLGFADAPILAGYKVTVRGNVACTATGNTGLPPSFTHYQSAESSVWVITHGLGFHPAISVEDSGGVQHFVSVHHDSPNHATINLTTAMTGTAYCS